MLILFTASTEDSIRHPEVEVPKMSQETLLMDRLSDHQAYPPDLLSFPLRGTTQISPAGGSTSGQERQSHSNLESPVKSPGYGVTVINPAIYSRFQSPTFQGSIPLISSKAGYVTLPRRPRQVPDSSLRPQVFSTLNGVIPYYDNFNSKFFSYGGHYYSLNKSEMDLGPISKMGSGFYDGSEEIEPAPSPAPGTPHATIPRNSLSSPNIHNQLLTLQAMAMNAHRPKTSEQRPLKVMLSESESLLKNPRDLRVGYSVNVVSGTVGRTKTVPKPPPKPRKRTSCEVKEPFLAAGENATQV